MIRVGDDDRLHALAFNELNDRPIDPFVVAHVGCVGEPPTEVRRFRALARHDPDSHLGRATVVGSVEGYRRDWVAPESAIRSFRQRPQCLVVHCSVS